MFVSEIDTFNYNMAVKNVEQNGLKDQIHGNKLNSFSLNKKQKKTFMLSYINGFIEAIRWLN